MRHCFAALLLTATIFGAVMTQTATAARAGEPLRAGLVGLDTSHVIAFTKTFNDPSAEGDVADVTVVAAYPGGSPDVAASADRLEGFTSQIREMGVEIVDSIDKLLEKVDVVLLESVDGRPHLEQARPVILAGKPLFIDKPVAASLADAIEIFRLAEEHNVPCFSSSSLRFSPGILGMRNDEAVGDVLGCASFGPCPTEPHHPDLFWYGVHGVEILFTIMGPGCQSVSRVHTDGADLVIGVWSDGRIGSFRGIRTGKTDYGAMVFGSKAIARSGGYAGYEPLVEEIATFFKTGQPPVAAAETIEMFAFMQGADESKRQGGASVSIPDLIKIASSNDGR